MRIQEEGVRVRFPFWFHMTNQTAVQLFNFRSNQIRVASLDGEPWFIGAEVAKVLGYKNVDTSMSHILSPLGSEEKMRAPKNLPLARQPLLISESGLYKMVMRSDLPAAREFQNWVTREVLPSIQSAKDGSKTGAYVVGQAPIATQANDPMASKGFTANFRDVS